MRLEITGTPLPAAFFCAALFSACTDQAGTRQSVTECPVLSTPIAQVQGHGRTSPLLGQGVTVRGVVTLVENGHGFYLEEPASDADPTTSNALFVQYPEAVTAVTVSSEISVAGTIVEIGRGRQTLTSIGMVDKLLACADEQALPLTRISLPIDPAGREAHEGMRITMHEKISITDVYRLGSGYLTLSGNGRQTTPTEILEPGTSAMAYQVENHTFIMPVQLRDDALGQAFLSSGMSVENITGVLTHDGRGPRMTLQSWSTTVFTEPSIPEPVKDGLLRIVGINLYNYFNGDGQGGGFPAPRGAETAGEFQHQRSRIGAAVQVLEPHIIAVMELENDGFDADSAAQDFVRLAESVTSTPWAVVRVIEPDTGDDAITVGLFYRRDLLKPIGPARTLSGPVFEYSRQPLAQLFQSLDDGDNLLVVVNHLKSKGSCPDGGDNADQGDGQGCWNPMRTAAANKMSGWVKDVAHSSGTDNVLMLGDMNAYRREDPIDAIREGGFVELMDRADSPTYSFAYFGQHGTLDYAFASPGLLGKVDQAFIWHVNSIFPAGTIQAKPWIRFSDHDPVVVDISLRQASTSD